MKPNEYQVSGVVEECRPSKSGKTISVKLNGKWFITKAAVIYQFQGKPIEGVAADSTLSDGKVLSWLNEFAAGQQGLYQNAPQQPASPQMGTPAPQPATPPTPPPAPWDHRERSIFIQSLCRHWIAPEDTPATVREKVQTMFKMVDEAELWALFK